MMLSIGHSSHLPVLMKLIPFTQGDVLEMGIGVYSTPYLHWACFEKRKLVSYENDKKYMRYFRRYKNNLHDLIFVENWEQANIEKPWDVAFIDHAPGIRRKEDIKRLANLAKYIVIHDTEPESENDYKYSEIYPLFKYRYVFKKNPTNTSVLSNFVNLSKLEI